MVRKSIAAGSAGTRRPTVPVLKESVPGCGWADPDFPANPVLVFLWRPWSLGCGFLRFQKAWAPPGVNPKTPTPHPLVFNFFVVPGPSPLPHRREDGKGEGRGAIMKFKTEGLRVGILDLTSGE